MKTIFEIDLLELAEMLNNKLLRRMLKSRFLNNLFEFEFDFKITDDFLNNKIEQIKKIESMNLSGSWIVENGKFKMIGENYVSEKQ